MNNRTMNKSIADKQTRMRKNSARNNQNRINPQMPVNGNLALKPESTTKKNARKIQMQLKASSKKRLFSRQTISKGLHSNFGPGFVVIMCVAIGFIFNSLVSYISMRAELFQKTKKIASLSSYLSNATIENDMFEQNIENNIDYDYIYDVATKELGMIYPSKRQIIYYFHTESEYVEQYKNIN